MLCSSILRIRSRKRCKFLLIPAQTAGKKTFLSAVFLLKEAAGEIGSVVKMLSKPRMGEKKSPFMRTQDTKKARILELFELYE